MPELVLNKTSIPTYNKYAQYDKSDKGIARAKRRNATKMDKRIEAYLDRPFMAWDGEGINEPDGSHTYIMLANSGGGALENRLGLPTLEVFELFYSAPTDHVHVGYGLGYDINMILRDMPVDKLREIYKNGSCFWRGYWVEWRGGKSLRIKRKGEKAFTLFDVLPFFQRSFVEACDEYLGNDWPDREQIIREKRNRGNFDYSRRGEIATYNQSELRTLVNLCDALKERLYRVGIRVNRWDGPGAIATFLYKKHGVKQSMGKIPDDVGEAGRFAYAGGRFEIIRKGHSTSGAYQYDIRSAYPYGITRLPCLAHGRWNKVDKPLNISPFGVYHINIDKPFWHKTRPQPLWRRNKDGTVYFSETPKGFYWSPEAQMVAELGYLPKWGWEYTPECECDPFKFVEPMYNKRAALKKAKDGAHVGLKLGLNSLYGKLAQQLGWEPGPPIRIPPYHCLEWAGYITSHCRAQVFRAAMHSPDDIIAFETDAVFSRVPLPLDIGEKLGQWEVTEYETLTYLKSGMYFGTKTNGEKVEKMRGVNKGTLTRTQMIDGIRRDTRMQNVVLHAEQTRFIGLGLAMSQDMSKWRKWITSPREIKVSLSGKRIDLLDWDDVYAENGDGWRETQPGIAHIDEWSHPYEVAWINPLPDIINPETGESLQEHRKAMAWESWGTYETY